LGLSCFAGQVLFIYTKENSSKNSAKKVHPPATCWEIRRCKQWAGPELNRRHVDFQSTALPPELPTRIFLKSGDDNNLPALMSSFLAAKTIKMAKTVFAIPDLFIFRNRI
jgi:hypothetical protein